MSGFEKAYHHGSISAHVGQVCTRVAFGALRNVVQVHILCHLHRLQVDVKQLPPALVYSRRVIPYTGSNTIDQTTASPENPCYDIGATPLAARAGDITDFKMLQN